MNKKATNSRKSCKDFLTSSKIRMGLLKSSAEACSFRSITDIVILSLKFPEANRILDEVQYTNGEKYLDLFLRVSHADILNSEIMESIFLQQNKSYAESVTSICACQVLLPAFSTLRQNLYLSYHIIKYFTFVP